MLLQKKTEKSMKKELDTIPYHPNIPQQLHWYRIILGKLDTIQYPHTNRGTRLKKIQGKQILYETQNQSKFS